MPKETKAKDDKAAEAPKAAKAPKTAKAPKAEKAAAPRKVNPALMKPLTPSKELAAVVGDKDLPRPEVVKKVWEYIKSKKLQNPENAREIVADDNLRKVFGRDKVTMFEMNKYLAQHLK
jgi:upstream activation factor subunit UAF30